MSLLGMMQKLTFPTLRTALGLSLVASLVLACSTDPEFGLEVQEPAFVSSGGSSLVLPASGGRSEIVVGTGGKSEEPSMGGASFGDLKPEKKTHYELPAGFTAAEGQKSGMDAQTMAGGYRLMGPLSELGVPGSEACANVLRVVVRDFEPTHVDFGAPKEPNAFGMVGSMGTALGEDRKPVREIAVYSETALAMEDWYHHGEGVENVPYVVDLWLEPFSDDEGLETFVFDSSRFFPLSSEGVLTNADADGVQRNFGFTTELHTRFEYQGGERFSFRGDDDVFVYIDKKLVVDLGGVHNPVFGEVQLDSLGLILGEVYDLDLFQAERNPNGSNFRIETSLDFSGCGEILAQDVVIR